MNIPYFRYFTVIVMEKTWNNPGIGPALGAPLTKKHINQNSVADHPLTSRTPGLWQRNDAYWVYWVYCLPQRAWQRYAEHAENCGGKVGKIMKQIQRWDIETHRKSKIMKRISSVGSTAKKAVFENSCAKWSHWELQTHQIFQIFQVQPLVPASPQ